MAQANGRIPVHLKNFQAWGDVEFVMEGLTVVVGPSNHGKSALTRAVRAVLRNGISAEYIRHGTKELSIHLPYGGMDITATRTTTKSTVYEVDGSTYSSLGSSLPPAMEGLKFGPVETSGVKLDPIFAGQFDSQFLISSTPAQLNAVLNAFSSTEKLDAGRKELKRRAAALESDAKALGSVISGLEDSFAKLDGTAAQVIPWQDQIREALAEVQRLTKASELTQEVGRLAEKLRVLQSRSLAIKAVERALQGVIPVMQALKASVSAAMDAAARDLSNRKLIALEGLSAPLRVCVQGGAALRASAIAAQSRRASMSAATKASTLEKLDDTLDATLRKFLACTKAKQAAVMSEKTDQLAGKIGALGSLETFLTPVLAYYKAAVRVRAAINSDVGPILAKAGKLTAPDFRIADRMLAGLSIINVEACTTLPSLDDVHQSLSNVVSQIKVTGEETQTASDLLEHMRHAGEVVSCPKCRHEFQPNPI